MRKSIYGDKVKTGMTIIARMGNAEISVSKIVDTDYGWKFIDEGTGDYICCGRNDHVFTV